MTKFPKATGSRPLPIGQTFALRCTLEDLFVSYADGYRQVVRSGLFADLVDLDGKKIPDSPCRCLPPWVRTADIPGGLR
jgi:hypothetical protein